MIGDHQGVKGTDHFSSAQADQIRGLLRKRAIADRAEQKRLRDELRAIAFYISDWSGPGFAPSDFDALVRSGQIKDHRRIASHSTRLACCCATEARERASRIKLLRGFQRASSGSYSGRGPRAPCSRHRATRSRKLPPHVPDVAGLYAIYGHTACVAPAGARRTARRPAAVRRQGPEDSLVSRGLKTHFVSGRAGSSMSSALCS